MTVLKVSGLTKNFGGLAAVSNVCLLYTSYIAINYALLRFVPQFIKLILIEY